jgi:hypothetical protein
MIRRIGRKLQGHSFADLIDELREGEILMGLYVNQARSPVATHLASPARMREMEAQWGPDVAYYGLHIDQANAGLDQKVSLQEPATFSAEFLFSLWKAESRARALAFHLLSSDPLEPLVQALAGETAQAS